MKVAPSPPLTYVCSSMHLSAKKEAQACGQCPRPTPSHPQYGRGEHLVTPKLLTITPITPAPPPGSVCPSKRKIQSPPGPVRAALAGRPWALQGAR